jgi:AhpC/TSA family
MDLRLLLAGLLFFGMPLCAQEEPPETPMTPRQDAIEELLSERESLEALNKAADAARALGVSEQALLEARFLFHVDRSEDAEIAALLPQFLGMKDKFKLADSEIFGSADDWLAVVEYVQALAALEKGDKAGFKQHITEAFWLSPKQGAAFAPHIDRIRLMDAMKEVKVDFAKSYKDTFGGKDVTLGDVIGERRAVLLHFWSPWSRECEATLTDFFITAEHLLAKDVAVASVLPETSEKVIADAKAMLSTTGKKVPGSWIVDTEKNPISAKLKVQSVPAVVLISAEGRILFNGHPTDDEFWKALEKIDPGIVRPEMREGD